MCFFSTFSLAVKIGRQVAVARCLLSYNRNFHSPSPTNKERINRTKQNTDLIQTFRRRGKATRREQPQKNDALSWCNGDGCRELQHTKRKQSNARAKKCVHASVSVCVKDRMWQSSGKNIKKKQKQRTKIEQQSSSKIKQNTTKRMNVLFYT